MTFPQFDMKEYNNEEGQWHAATDSMVLKLLVYVCICWYLRNWWLKAVKEMCAFHAFQGKCTHLTHFNEIEIPLSGMVILWFSHYLEETQPTPKGVKSFSDAIIKTIIKIGCKTLIFV